jgi:HK97 family phage prohead protease
VFNCESRDLGGFTEVIEPSALEGVISKSDILCLLNHNEDKGILARSNMGTGSLTLEIDEKGLKYSFEAPNTSLGDELLEGLKRGDISASSFAFKVGEDKWTKRNDGSYLRTINAIEKMFDVSPVYRAAYDATTVSVDTRGLDEAKAKEKRDMEEYYKQLREGLEK